MTLRGLIEFVRRLVLAAGVAAGAALYFLSGFAPFVTVAPMQTATPAGEVAARAASPGSLLAPGQGRASEPPARISVSGPQWQTLFAQVASSFSANLPVAGWEHRIPARQLAEAKRENPRRAAFSEKDREDEADRVARLKAEYGMDVSFTGSFHQLYFFAAEPPFNEIAASLVTFRDTLLLCTPCQGTRPLKAVLNPAPKITGFFDVITVPQAFAFPHRPIAMWPPLFALAIYLLIPWGRVPENTLAYARWRVMLGDFGGLLLFGMMVFLPFGVIGGTVEALRGYPWLLAVFWLIAAMGLVVLGWDAWAASYRLHIEQERLRIETATGLRDFAIADLAAVDLVIIRPPKWLIILSWMAVFLGGSRIQRLGQTGRSLLLSTSGANGLRLRHKDGSRAYVWYSDQLGGTAMPHYAVLEQSLKAAGLLTGQEPETIRAVFPPSS